MCNCSGVVSVSLGLGFEGSCPCQTATYAGALCDVDFTTAELFSEAEVRDAMSYWWGPKRARECVDGCFFVSVLAKEDTEVGGLILSEGSAKVASLVLAWSMAVESKDEELSKLYCSLASNVLFGVSRIHASEGTSTKVVLRLIQTGEDASKVATESGNFLPFILASRLVRPGRGCTG